MTVEQRQVFIACDGKEFKTEEECLNYEKSVNKLPDIVISLKKVKKICREQLNCCYCIFYNDCSNRCIFSEEFSEDWELERLGG